MNPFVVYILQISTVFGIVAALAYFSMRLDMPLSLFLGLAAVVGYTALYFVFIKDLLH